MKASQLTNSRPPRILLYGPPGTGKTGLLSQLSGGYLIDLDDGMLTAKNLKDQFTKYRLEIEFDTFVDTNPNVPKAWFNVKTKLFEISRLCREGKYPFDGLAIDSLTRLSQLCQNYVMSNNGGIDKTPQIQHYGMMVHELRNMLQLITSLPLLVIVATHEQPFEDSGGADFFKPKALGNKLPDEICCMFDEVWYTSVKNLPASKGSADFFVSWIPSTLHEARTRSGVLKELSIKELGLRGLLKEIGYEYKHDPQEKKVEVQSENKV